MNLVLLNVSDFIYRSVWSNNTIIDGQGDFVPFNAIPYLISQIRTLPTLYGKDCSVIACFDSTHSVKSQNYRKVFTQSEYKGNRDGRKVPNEVFAANLALYQMLEEFGVTCKKVDGYEADDIIYTYWKYNHQSFDHTYIYNNDSDLFFMVCEDTTIVKVGKNKIPVISMSNYRDAVLAGYDSPYNTIVFSKLVYGDKSDNIPGLDKCWLKYLYGDLSDADYRRLGDLDFARSILQRVIDMHPDLPDANIAMDLFNIVMPYDIYQEDDFSVYETTVDTSMITKFNYDPFSVNDTVSAAIEEYLSRMEV